MKKSILIAILLMLNLSLVIAITDDSLPCKWGGSVQINGQDANGSLIIPYNSSDYSQINNYQNPAGTTNPLIGSYVINVLATSADNIFFMIENKVADQSPSLWVQGEVRTLGLTFTDSDNDGYSIGYVGYTGVYKDCDDDNSSISPNAIEVCDGLDNDCDGTIDEGFIDTDNDSFANCVDSDDDGDGILDTTDSILGTVNDVQGNQGANLIFNINKTQDPNSWSGLDRVIFKDGLTGNVIVEFDYNFSNNVLDLTKLEITTSTDGYSIAINGIDLTAQGLTKTVYINIDSTKNRVCVLDIDNVTISQVTVDCTGTNEKAVVCNGVADSNGYTCTSINSTWYKIDGLKHSGVGQYSYSAPTTTSSGGGGGGGSSTPINCSTKWSCTEWTTCSDSQQTRICTKTNSLCSDVTMPLTSQSCTMPAGGKTTTEETPATTTPGILGAVIGGGTISKIIIWVMVALILLWIIVKIIRKGKKSKTKKN
jgi:hypothetical protein